MLNWIVYIKMDLALNNLQRLICHKTHKPTNQVKKRWQNSDILLFFFFFFFFFFSGLQNSNAIGWCYNKHKITKPPSSYIVLQL